MAVVPDSPSKPISSLTDHTPNDSTKRNPSSPIRCSKSSKRVKCTQDQVFDEELGTKSKKSCHQCRQKSSFFVASCKNQRNNKLCSFGFCRKCLLNRYGEKAEEVGLLSDWKCPKCRDICNCSQCMKKKGKQPTGFLVHTAKATKFSSVYDMLFGKETNNLKSTNVVHDDEDDDAFLPDKVIVVASPKKSEKESSFEKKSDLNLQEKPLVKEPVVASPKESETKNPFVKKSDSNLQENTPVKEHVLASMKKTGKENVFVGKSRPKLKVNSLTSYFSPKHVGECKRKNTENGEGNENACNGKKDTQLKKDIFKKSKILKERILNSNENGLKVEKGNHVVVVAAEMNSYKKSCNAKERLQKSTKEEEKKGITSKKTDPQMVIYKDNSLDCIKTDGKVVELCRSPSFDKKKMDGSGNMDNNQLQCNPTLNSSKTEDLTIEKGDSGVLPGMKISKKSPIAKQSLRMQEEKTSKPYAVLSETSDPQIKKSEEVSQGCINKEDMLAEGNVSQSVDENRMPNSTNNDNEQTTILKPAACELKNTRNVQDASLHANIPLPQGTDLTNVAGIDLPAKDVGHALQFLEFCSAFGQFFHLKKGHPEAILRELTRGCTRRTRTQNQYSSVVQFHIQLLSLLLKDSGEQSLSLSTTSSGNSWLQTLGKCISESECKFDELPSNCFNKDGSGYYMLDSSRKLRLLNFLCDEALCTADLRTWIDEQSSMFFEKEKEAKQKVLIAKEKEKRVKQHMKDEMEKAMVDGMPLSISEHDDLVSKMRKEAENAHNEMLEAIKNVPNKKQISAVRTDSVLFDRNGHVFWRLKAYSGQPDILVQDIGTLDPVTAEDKWFTYDGEQKGMIENYISVRSNSPKLLDRKLRFLSLAAIQRFRGKRVRLQKVPNMSPTDTCQA